jgi:hypothetical protein
MIPGNQIPAFKQSIIDEAVLGRKTSIWHEAVEEYKKNWAWKVPDEVEPLIRGWKEIRRIRKVKRGTTNKHTSFLQSLINMKKLERDLNLCFKLKGHNGNIRVVVGPQNTGAIVHTDNKGNYCLTFPYKTINYMFPPIAYSWLHESDNQHFDQITVYTGDQIDFFTVKPTSFIGSIRNSMTSETLQKLISDGDSYLKEMIRRAK